MSTKLLLQLATSQGYTPVRSPPFWSSRSKYQKKGQYIDTKIIIVIIMIIITKAVVVIKRKIAVTGE